MGWLYLYDKPHNVKEYFVDKFNYENEVVKQRALDIAIVKFRTLYAAIESINKSTGARTVFAAVVMLDFRNGEMGYKYMDESCGPFQCECPKRILKLLTETDNEHAKEWRAACWAKIEKNQKLVLKEGAIVKFNTPIRFMDGLEYSEMKVVKNGRTIRFTSAENTQGYWGCHRLYRIDRATLKARVVV